MKLEKHYNIIKKGKKTHGPFYDYETAKKFFDDACAKSPNKKAVSRLNIKPLLSGVSKKSKDIQEQKKKIEKESTSKQVEYAKQLLESTMKDEVLWENLKSHSSLIMSEQFFKCKYIYRECLLNVIAISKDDHSNTHIDLLCGGQSYVENYFQLKSEIYKEIVKQQKRTFKEQSTKNAPKKKKIVKLKNGDYVVRTNLYKCRHQDHALEQVDAIVNVVIEGSNHIKEMTLPAAYCSKCNCYFILKMDFEKVLNMGTPVCKLIQDVTFYKGFANTTFDNLQIESILKENKYNVQKNTGYTDQERQDILANMIDNGIITPIQIVSYLKAFASRKANSPSYQLAVSKWRADIDFVSSYRKGENRRVYIKSVNYLKYLKGD